MTQGSRPVAGWLERLGPEAVAGLLAAAFLGLVALVVVVQLTADGGNDPSASAEPSSGPSTPAAATSTPASGSSVVGPALVIDDRLRETATELEAALAADPIDVTRLAELIRQVNSQVTVGTDRIVADLIADPATAATGSELRDAWTAIAETCRDALDRSLTQGDAYVQAATLLVEEIDALAPIDARLRALAGGSPSP